MADITSIFGGAFVPPVEESVKSGVEQFIDAMIGDGFNPPDNIVADGQIHRFDPDNKRDKAGWYILYDGEIKAGAYGNWRESTTIQFRENIGRQLSMAETLRHRQRMDEIIRQRNEELEGKRDRAADHASEQWETCIEVDPRFPYLKTKQINPNGAKIDKQGRLILPIFVDDEIAGLQTIDQNGNKMFTPGSTTKGGYWWIGDITTSPTVCIAEGFATAASIYEATKIPTVIAFSAGNLPNVAKIIRDKRGNNTRIIICGDNDKSEKGQEKSSEAANAIGAELVIPPERGDANDYVNNGHDLAALFAPKSSGWLISFKDFIKQPSPIQWLIKGWMQRESLVMIHGASGNGKTFVALDMVCRIASGCGDFFGQKVNDGEVLYLAGEGHHGLKARVAGWAQQNNIDDIKMWISKSGTDLNKPEGYSLVVNEISERKLNPSVIVVDTLHRFLCGDENSAVDTKTMLDACAGLINQYKCAVVLVHHTGVSTETQHRARGSSAWRGALEQEISIQNKDGAISINQLKNKDAELRESIYCELQQIAIDNWFDEDGDPVTTAVLRQVDKPESESKVITASVQMLNRSLDRYAKVLPDGKVFVTAQSIKDSTLQDVESGKYKNTNAARKALSVGKKELVANKIMREFADGYIITDDTIASIFRIANED